MDDQRFFRVLEIVCSLIVTWESVKMLNPELAGYQDQFICRLKEQFGKRKPVEVTQQQANEFVAEVTKYVRDHKKDN